MKEKKNNDEELSLDDLEKEAYKVDLLPKNFKKMGIFQMGGYYFLHVANKKCILISIDGETDLELPKA